MKKFYPTVIILLLCTQISFSQAIEDCSDFTASFSTTESRCASTGVININASGGSGKYSYKILEPVAGPLTSTSSLSGLAPGTYTVFVKDMMTNCTLVLSNIVVNGAYSDPRFQLTGTDVSCTGGTDGAISVVNQQYGRSPFSFTIIAPSPASVGQTNNHGSFSNLPPGQYYIQLRDSCGGVQTRTMTIQDYNWTISNTTITELNCTTIAAAIQLTDNKGNTNQSGTAFTGFQYGVVNAVGDTTWNASASFNHTRAKLRTITFVVKDRCGFVKSFNWTNGVPQLNATATTSSPGCSTFSASVTSPQNLTNPLYTLRQGFTTIQTNSTGTFTNIPFGNYCIDMRDACYDTTITRCFAVAMPVPAVAATPTISNRQCSTFSAAITGQANLFNPQYCLYNSSNTLVSCNTTGSFPNIPYGQYTIRVTSAAPCYDTTIVRTINELAPRPAVAANPSYSSQTCASFTAGITGQTNLFSPNYCLYNNGVLVGCNTTGSFTGLQYGVSYCISVTSAAPCYDTTIQRCFTLTQPVPAAANAVISNRTCSDFTVAIPSVTNIPDPQYCLFTSANVAMGCNTTGVFNNLPYGNYYIDVVTTSVTTVCPTTSVRKTFSASLLTPSIGASIAISNKACATFTAAVTSQSNLINPQFCLTDMADNQIACNSTGTFTGLAYGSYKIVTTNGCGQVFTRTFTESAVPTNFSLLATESCTIGATDIRVTIATGQGPYVARVVNPLNTVIATQSFSTSTYTFTALPALTGSLQYRVAVTNACNVTDTVWVSPKGSIFSRQNSVAGKCPGGQSENGSGNLSIDLSTNIGFFAPVIIKKDAATVSTPANVTTNISSSLRRYEFTDLQPATYVIEYNISTCNRRVYDTIIVEAYRFPDLQNSAAYQCDNSNFSVSAVAAGGVAPFSYEIIGSNPTSISIVTPAQSNSVFNINNGETYSLVRMRAIDACGNGTLNDVSVLPLGQLTISSNNIDCYSNNLTLTVDTIPNATYTWYRKYSPTDSVLIHTSQSFNIPYLLPSDTGVYVCKTSVNSNCLVRISRYRIQGDCSMVLPVEILSFTGKMVANQVPLTWKTDQEKNIREYQVERSTGGTYQAIGTVTALNNSSLQQYNFTDAQLPVGKFNYRLRIVSKDSKVTYSQIISFTREASMISASPNPVKNVLNIRINSASDAQYDISILNMTGQVFHRQTSGRIVNGIVSIPRSNKMVSGMYLVQVTNQETGVSFTQKLVYE